MASSRRSTDPLASLTSGNGDYLTGINDSGEIVGTYYDAAGNGHGFLATSAAVPSRRRWS